MINLPYSSLQILYPPYYVASTVFLLTFGHAIRSTASHLSPSTSRRTPVLGEILKGVDIIRLIPAILITTTLSSALWGMTSLFHARSTIASTTENAATQYASTCAYCHGSDGSGDQRLNAPALWGRSSVIPQSAYASLPALSQYIRQYMPPTPLNGVNPGSLPQTEAQRLAAYLLHKNTK